jgi:hypothetical protein
MSGYWTDREYNHGVVERIRFDRRRPDVLRYELVDYDDWQNYAGRRAMEIGFVI